MNFVEAVQARRQLGLSRRRRRVVPRALPPTTIEREYARAILMIVETVRAAMRPLLDAMPRLLESAARERHDAGESDQVKEIMRQARARLASSLNVSSLESLARLFAQRTQTWQRLQLGKQLQAALGVDLFSSDSKIRPLVDGFVAENVDLIKDVPERIVGQLERSASRALQNGTLLRDYQKEVQSIFNVGKNRAKLIARDQIGKLNGQIAAARQKDLGVTRFVWRTANDERVRGNPSGKYPKAKPSHWDRDGKTFSYKKLPPSEWPGVPIQCRCFAEPVFDELLGEGTEQATAEVQEVAPPPPPPRKRAPAPRPVPAPIAPPPPPVPAPAAQPPQISREAERQAAREFEQQQRRLAEERDKRLDPKVREMREQSRLKREVSEAQRRAEFASKPVNTSDPDTPFGPNAQYVGAFSGHTASKPGTGKAMHSAEYRGLAQQTWEAATPEQRIALRKYVANGYQEINRGLRTGQIHPTTLETVHTLDDLVAPLPRELILHRGQDLRSTPDFKIGDVAEWTSFTSTTASETLARDFGGVDDAGRVHFEIEAPAGSKMIAASGAGTPDNPEDEFLLQRKQRFQVLSIDANAKGGKRIRVRLLNE